MAVLFNTHAFFKTIENDFSKEQAETLTKALDKSFDELASSHLANKQDLSETKIEIVKWVVGMGLGIILTNFGLLLAVIKVFGK